MKIALKGTPINNYPQPMCLAETPEQLIQALRSIRGFMLAESDWTQVADSPLDDAVKTEWRLWRQEMRDVTNSVTIENVGDYFEISDPPSIGTPKHWHHWEYEKYAKTLDRYMSLQTGSQTTHTHNHDSDGLE
jgi:hypothetical protein